MVSYKQKALLTFYLDISRFSVRHMEDACRDLSYI